ncbi:MAG: hypothetical protein FD143_1396 [Ignavibacteria bacterium]|nr:MAG: hypothetical protein FD143_1396 [Ignavibacteria bacterium]KAF0160549.1 MAG: hypothetical protein FD188_1620 [Ignavibacteria bacterium]
MGLCNWSLKMEYLSLKEIASLKKDINHELYLLLSDKSAVTKPNSLQWLFFVDCVNTLFIPQTNSNFNSLTNSNKAQLKYEIENKLRNFYLRPGRKIDFVFQMIHKKELKNIFYEETDSYPSIGEYAVLVRDTSKEISPNNGLTEKDIKEYIERVVTEAVETEFEAYQTLPQIIEEELLNSWFCPFGPAKKEIMHVLTRHVERGWVLTNPMNPSTKRILAIKVKDIKKKEIFVSTTEYWYLRWWDTKKNSYAFPYRETNHQQYILRKDTGIWKVYETIRPSPRTSIPHRRKYL